MEPPTEVPQQHGTLGAFGLLLGSAHATRRCLFSTMFRVRCDDAMMSNARPSPVPRSRQARTEGSDPFADPHDLQLHEWVRERFRSDLRKWRVTPERCATELCAEAAQAFGGNSTSHF